MKFLKGNQIIIYVIALMLVAAGYLNYTTKNDNQVTQTSAMQTNSTEMADIGDASLVNSNDVVSENTSDTKNETNPVNETNTTNTTEEQQPETTQPTVNPTDYFANSKLERDKMYSQMIEIYEKVLNSTTSLETQKQSATDEIQKINDTKNSIMICENLIKAKGFENSVIFVNGESINIIIGTTTLEKEDVAQIQNIIEREMKTESQNIHIAIK